MALPSPIFQKPEDHSKQEEKKIYQPKFNHYKTQQNQKPERNYQRKPYHKKKEWNFPCNYCNVGYDTQEELFAHRRTHERCPFEGCKFNAASEVVAIHLQKVHCKREFFAKIQQLTTPEEIEKWREERRKRYPTTQNVILRQQAREIRKQRGEKLVDKKSRFGDRKNLPRNNINQGKPTQKKKKNVVRPKEIISPKAIEVEAEESSEDEEPVRKIPKFTGTSKMTDYHSIESSIKQKSALSVLGLYGSESEADSEEEQAEELSKSKENNETEPKTEETEVLIEESDNEPPEQAPINHESLLELPAETKPSAQKQLNRRQRRQRNHQARSENLTNPENPPNTSNIAMNSIDCLKPIMKRPVHRIKKIARPTNEFLEKLLREDIIHERNILLQCVSFVVKNNFFGVGQESKPNLDSCAEDANLLDSKMDTSNTEIDPTPPKIESSISDSLNEISNSDLEIPLKTATSSTVVLDTNLKCEAPDSSQL